MRMKSNFGRERMAIGLTMFDHADFRREAAILRHSGLNQGRKRMLICPHCRMAAYEGRLDSSEIVKVWTRNQLHQHWQEAHHKETP